MSLFLFIKQSLTFLFFAFYTDCTVLYRKVTNLEWYTQQGLVRLLKVLTVLYRKVTNLEWYTQQFHKILEVELTVLYRKVTNLEWYTQPAIAVYYFFWYCFISQSYKSWMIYTTYYSNLDCEYSLFYIAKLQILNDIHNPSLCIIIHQFVKCKHPVYWYIYILYLNISCKSTCQSPYISGLYVLPNSFCQLLLLNVKINI